MPNIDFNTLVAGLLFGIIGMTGLKIARNTSSFRKVLISSALIAFPYFITNALLTWGLGILLTLALCFWNE